MDARARAELSRLVDGLFQRRRQSLARVLSTIGGSREAGERWLAAAGLDPKARAEDLDLEALRRLSRLAPPTPGEADRA
jgi:16S rRNA (adenine1518-N6/adenine1519-N6)-dimethyltransferase